jgi:hypothetical protein
MKSTFEKYEEKKVGSEDYRDRFGVFLGALIGFFGFRWIPGLDLVNNL